MSFLVSWIGAVLVPKTHLLSHMNVFLPKFASELTFLTSYVYDQLSLVLKKLKMRKFAATLMSVAMVASGCSTASKDIAATYVSPIQYQSYDCDQLAAETQRIQAKITQIGGRLDESASNDKVLTGVGVVLFFPVLFALGGTKQQEAEYARLKGEYDAVQQAVITKKCLNAAQQTGSVSQAPSQPAAAQPVASEPVPR